MKVGICKLELRIPYAHSLKEKRSVVKRLTGKLRQKYNISICEVDNHNLWQIATLGIAIAGNEGAFIERVLQNLIDYVENNFDGEIWVLHTEIISI